MGSCLAGKEVPEELGPLETAEWDSQTSQLGRQGPRMPEAEGVSRRSERIGKDTEASGALASPAISWSFCDSDYSLPTKTLPFLQDTRLSRYSEPFHHHTRHDAQGHCFPQLHGVPCPAMWLLSPSPLYLKQSFSSSKGCTASMPS